MKTWLTADWHLGEDRFELMGRPFTTRDEHIETIIKNHNALVAPDDEVIMVGDVCYQKTPEFLPVVGRMNGKKTLVRGNHDRVFTDAQLAQYFGVIIGDGGGFHIQVGDLPCYVTHYPTEGKQEVFNLVGHIHAAWKYQLNMFNVGVDVNNFRPVSLDRIQFHFDAVCKFYDRDVWVGYEPINAAYQGKRGKQNSYFHP
jgi:calcineurin-like phosphoesterase family protein